MSKPSLNRMQEIHSDWNEFVRVCWRASELSQRFARNMFVRVKRKSPVGGSNKVNTRREWYVICKKYVC